MSQKFVNNAKSTLAGTLTTGATTIQLVDASSFPVVTSPEFLLVTIEENGQFEIIRLDSPSKPSSNSNVLNIAAGGRGQESTITRQFNVGARVECRITAGTLAELVNVTSASIAGEAIVRSSADNALQTNITAEATARVAADSALKTAFNSSLAAETAARLRTPGGVQYAAAGGTVNAITATFPITFSNIPDGVIVSVHATGANTVTNPTFNADSLGARFVVKENGVPLGIGDIAGANHHMLLQANNTDNTWILLNPKSIAPVAAVPAVTTQVLTTNGYRVNSDGLIEQWGTLPINNTTFLGAVHAGWFGPLPITFPTAVLNVSVTLLSTNINIQGGAVPMTTMGYITTSNSYIGAYLFTAGQGGILTAHIQYRIIGY